MSVTHNERFLGIPADVREIIYEMMYDDLSRDGSMAPVATTFWGSSEEFQARINSVPPQWDGATRVCHQMRDELREVYYRHRVCRFVSREIINLLDPQERRRARRGQRLGNREPSLSSTDGHRILTYGSHLALKFKAANHFQLRLPTAHICGLLRNVELRLAPPGVCSRLTHSTDEAWFDGATFRFDNTANDWLLPLRSLQACGFTWLRELTIRVPIHLFKRHPDAWPLICGGGTEIAASMIHAIPMPVGKVNILWEELSVHDRINTFT